MQKKKNISNNFHQSIWENEIQLVGVISIYVNIKVSQNLGSFKVPVVAKVCRSISMKACKYLLIVRASLYASTMFAGKAWTRIFEGKIWPQVAQLQHTRVVGFLSHLNQQAATAVHQVVSKIVQIFSGLLYRVDLTWYFQHLRLKGEITGKQQNREGFLSL